MITETQLRGLKKGAILNTPHGKLFVFLKLFMDWQGNNEYDTQHRLMVRVIELHNYEPSRSIHDPALRYPADTVKRYWTAMS